MVMWIHGWKALTLGYHTATFGGFRHSGNRDKIFLVCRVISKDHVFKGLCDFMGGNTSICDVTFQDYTWSNGLVTLWKGRQLLIVWSHPARPDGQRHFGSGDVFNLSCYLTWTHVQRVVWLFRKSPLCQV